MAFDANGNWINDAPTGMPPGANGAPPMGSAGGPAMGAPPTAGSMPRYSPLGGDANNLMLPGGVSGAAPQSGQFGPPQQFGMQNRMGMGGSGSPWGSAIQGAMQGMQRPMGSQGFGMQGPGGNPAQQQQQTNIMQGARALGGGLGQFMQQRRANNTNMGAGPSPSSTLGSQMTPSVPTPPPVSAPATANNGAAAGPLNPTGNGNMPTMASGGVALGPGEPAQVGGLPGTTYSEPGSTMRRYAPVGPISPKVQMSPKPEEMGHHLPTKLRIGKRINVKLPRPSSKGLGGVSAK